MKITVDVGPELFAFASEAEWVRTATSRFRRSGHCSHNALCVAADGAVLISGAGFRAAAERGAYPVRVYSLKAR